MLPLIMNGNEVSQKILEELKNKIESLKTKTGKTPGLAVVLVGDNPASQAYVSMKQKACHKIGIQSFEHKVSADYGQEKLNQLIHQLNEDPNVHGILVQLPLPAGYDENQILQLIDPKKDVDGFHPENVGKLLLGLPTFRSCTPYGVIKLLEYYQIKTEGVHVAIIGRSNIVGKPLAAMLIQKDKTANATVTVCHSQSHQLKEITRQADIVVAAVGKPYYVTAEMVREGAIVIDVGINKVEDSQSPRGYKLIGDVDFDSVSSKVKAITPVPGGVGPMTIAMLLSNTVQSFEAHIK